MSSRQSMPPQRLQPAETARVVFDYLQRGGFPRTAKVFEQEAHSLLRANTSSQKALPAQGLHTILTEYVDFAAKARMRSSFASSFGNARAVRDCLSKLSSVMDDYLATAHCELGPEEQAPRSVLQITGPKSAAAAAPSAAVGSASRSAPTHRRKSMPSRRQLESVQATASSASMGASAASNSDCVLGWRFAALKGRSPTSELEIGERLGKQIAQQMSVDEMVHALLEDPHTYALLEAQRSGSQNDELPAHSSCTTANSAAESSAHTTQMDPIPTQTALAASPVPEAAMPSQREESIPQQGLGSGSKRAAASPTRTDGDSAPSEGRAEHRAASSKRLCLGSACTGGENGGDAQRISSCGRLDSLDDCVGAERSRSTNRHDGVHAARETCKNTSNTQFPEAPGQESSDEPCAPADAQPPGQFIDADAQPPLEIPRKSPAFPSGVSIDTLLQQVHKLS